MKYGVPFVSKLKVYHYIIYNVTRLSYNVTDLLYNAGYSIIIQHTNNAMSGEPTVDDHLPSSTASMSCDRLSVRHLEEPSDDTEMCGRQINIECSWHCNLPSLFCDKVNVIRGIITTSSLILETGCAKECSFMCGNSSTQNNSTYI